MTTTTIDTNIEVSRSPWTQARPPLWGFDEVRERERFIQLERRLLQLEVDLFADFGVQFVAGARECVCRLFVVCPSVRVPSISAQPDGQIVCTWTNSQKERVTVRCSGLNHLQYSIAATCPGQRAPVHHAWGALTEPAVFWDENPVARRIAE